MPIKISWFIGLLAVVCACSEPECTVNTDPRLRIRFVTQRRIPQTNRFAPADTTIRVVAVTAIGAAPNRFVSQIRDTTVTGNVAALLSQTADQTTYVIKWDTARTAASRRLQNTVFTDTLTIGYQLQTYFVSEGCGFNYKYNDLNILRETFTKPSSSRRILTVSLTYPIADETSLSNITITFRPFLR